jgi:hypothetical protein
MSTGPSEAWLNGWHAHRQGQKLDPNPYNPDTQARSFHQWLAGWCSRFEQEKHGRSTAQHDNALFDD